MTPDDSSFKPPSSSAGSSGGVWQPPSAEELQDYFPQYEIVALLGRGGMGAVYKGWQRSLERFVAIKILPPGLDDDDAQFTERFKQEAKSMARLMHPGIVAVFDAGETPTGLLYFVMEFVEGTDVAHMVQAQGKLPPDHALAITAHVCDALQYAHTHGIVHRDIKPANIMVNTEGAVKVADFGLAKHSDPGVSGLTKTNMAMGTPDFVAPEALITGMNVDGRADLYAVGVMLYQMLTGNIPRGMFTMPSVMVKTDPRFDMIIAKAMQTDREQRYESAAMLRRDLDVILTVPLVKAGDAHSSAAIPKQQPQQKPVAKQPQKPQAQQPAPKKDAAPVAAPAQKSQTQNPKSKVGTYIGIAATIAVLGALAFLFTGKKTAVEPDAAAAAEAGAKPAPPIKVAEASKPPVIKTPAPKPAASTTAPTTIAWRDWVADGRRGGGFKPPFFQNDGKEVRGLQFGGFDFVRSAQDAAVRVTWIPVPDTSLTFRTLSKSEGYDSYVVQWKSDGTLLVVHRNGDDAGKLKTLKSFAYPAGIDPKAEHTLEARIIGSVLSLWVNGKVMGSVDNLQVRNGRFEIGSQPGLIVKKLEYAVLDGVSEIPAAPSPVASGPVVSAPAALDGQWVDGLAEWWAKPVTPGRLTREGGGARVLEYRAVQLKGGEPVGDVAVRSTIRGFTGRCDINLRQEIVDNVPRKYVARLLPTGSVDLGIEHDTQKVEPLATSPAIPGFDPARSHVFEASAQGPDLRVAVDGREVISIRNSARPAGLFYIASDPGALIEKLEYRELPASAPAKTTPAVATTPAPAMPKPEAPAPAPAVPPSHPPAETKAAAAVSMPPAGESKAAAAPAADPVAIRLAEIEKQFLAAYEKQAGAAHKAAVADLNAKFTAALDRSIATVSQAGKLDEALALRNEKTLIQTSGTVPEEDAADTPEALKTLRKTYRATMTTLLATRDKNAAPLHTAYDRALAAYQEELTKAQKLDDALRVKAVREHVSEQRETPAAPQPTSPGTGAAISSAASGKTSMPIAPTAPPLSADKVLPSQPKATQDEVRALVEWCLGVRQGTVEVLDSGQRRRIQKVDDLPKGKLTLLHFFIYDQPMSDDWKKWLAVLGRVPELESLFFYKNPGPFPMEALRGLTRLKSLTLSPATLDESAFAHLGRLKSLELLTLYCNQFTGTGLGYLNENLLELSMNSQTISAEGLAYLPRFKKLRRLVLKDSAVTDDMLAGLATLTELEALDVTNTKLDGSFLAHLPANSKLKRLVIENVGGFKPEHLTHLARLKYLEELSLPSFEPGPAGMAAIASLSQLRVLVMNNNTVFTGESLKGLKGFGSLTLLDLNVCPVSDAGLAAIADAMPALERLGWARRDEKKKGTATPEGFAAALKRMRNLTSILLSGNELTDEWLPAIAEAKGVNYMMLNDSRVTDQGVAHLMKLPLGYLRLDGTQVTDAVIPILKTCPTLVNVPVGGTKMTDAGKAELQRVLDAHRGK